MWLFILDMIQVWVFFLHSEMRGWEGKRRAGVWHHKHPLRFFCLHPPFSKGNTIFQEKEERRMDEVGRDGVGGGWVRTGEREGESMLLCVRVMLWGKCVGNLP